MIPRALIAAALAFWPVSLFVFGVVPAWTVEAWNAVRRSPFTPGPLAAAVVVGLYIAAETIDRRYGDRLCAYARRFAPEHKKADH